MKTVIYSGYTYSGGILAGLILRELESIVVPANMEFRLMKERHGICDLEEAIFNIRDPEIIDLAFKDFKWLTANFAMPNSFFRRTGFGYDHKTNNKFTEETSKYIESLVDYKYPTNWHFFDFKESYLRIIFWRIIRRITKNYRYGRTDAYLSYPNHNKFIDCTKLYLKEIIHHMIGKEKDINNHIIALPKAVNPYSYKELKKAISYFESCKIIMVDRDPRDLYLELLRSGKDRYIIGSNDSISKAKSFINFFRKLRVEQDDIINDENILLLQFEDLCFEYEESLKNIYNFLGMESKNHIKKGKFFKPNESRQNINIWHNASSDEMKAINLIENELPSFLHKY